MKDKNKILEKLSSQFIEAMKMLTHISFWVKQFKAGTKERMDQQRREIMKYPVMLYDWNEQTKLLLNKYCSDFIAGSFLKNDDIIVSLKDIDMEKDEGYYSFEAFSDELNFDPLTEKYSDSNLEILTRIFNNKIEVLKQGVVEIREQDNDKVVSKKEITLIEIVIRPNNIQIFINKNYSTPWSPNNVAKETSYWNSILQIAKTGECPYNESLIKYFNSNSKNPLYDRLGYERSKILKKTDKTIVGNIVINIIAEEHVRRSLGQTNRT